MPQKQPARRGSEHPTAEALPLSQSISGCHSTSPAFSRDPREGEHGEVPVGASRSFRRRTEGDWATPWRRTGNSAWLCDCWSPPGDRGPRVLALDVSPDSRARSAKQVRRMAAASACRGLRSSGVGRKAAGYHTQQAARALSALAPPPDQPLPVVAHHGRRLVGEPCLGRPFLGQPAGVPL